MPRLLSPDDKCLEVDVRGLRYRGKTINVTDPVAVKQLREAGYTMADTAGVITRGGFACECGFQSYFRLCSRCGSECKQ